MKPPPGGFFVFVHYIPPNSCTPRQHPVVGKGEAIDISSALPFAVTTCLHAEAPMCDLNGTPCTL